MAGRASKYTEVVRADALGELFDKAQPFLLECLNGKSKEDKRWATEQVMKLAAKTIPQVQKIGGDSDNRTPIPISILGGASQAPKVSA